VRVDFFLAVARVLTGAFEFVFSLSFPLAFFFPFRFFVIFFCHGLTPRVGCFAKGHLPFAWCFGGAHATIFFFPFRGFFFF